MQKWPRELPRWFPWRIQIIWMMLLLLPSGHNNRIHVCRWWSSFHNPVTCTTPKPILCYWEKLRAQGNATEPSQQLSQRVREPRVQQLLLLLRLFRPLPLPLNPWLKLFVSPYEFFCCVSSLCSFSHTEKMLPVCWIIEVKLLANSKSGSTHL